MQQNWRFEHAEIFNSQCLIKTFYYNITILTVNEDYFCIYKVGWQHMSGVVDEFISTYAKLSPVSAYQKLMKPEEPRELHCWLETLKNLPKILKSKF